MFIQNKASFKIEGKPVTLSLTTDYPKTGKVKVTITNAEADFSLNIRIPSFAEEYKINLNGSLVKGEKQNNYFRITDVKNNDEIELSFPMNPRIIYPNPKVHQTCGKAAIARGPEIFCFEEIDNGKNLAALSIDTDAPLTEHWQENLLGGIMQIKAKGRRLIEPKESESFSEKFIPKTQEAVLTALPYGYWGNRTSGETPGEMLVWIRC